MREPLNSLDFPPAHGVQEVEKEKAGMDIKDIEQALEAAGMTLVAVPKGLARQGCELRDTHAVFPVQETRRVILIDRVAGLVSTYLVQDGEEPWSTQVKKTKDVETSVSF